MAEIESAAVVGDVFIDLATRVEMVPSAGSGIWGTPLIASGGGCGGNMAAALACLGVSTRLLTVVGDDEYGRLAISQLDNVGVDTSMIVVDPSADSGAVIILIDDRNERTIIPCALGAAYQQLQVKHVDTLLANPPKHLLLTGVALGANPTGESYLYLARMLPDTTLLYFDPNLRQPAETLTQDLAERFRTIAARADVVIAGDQEVADLGLKRHGNQVFIVKSGESGSTLTDRSGQVTHVPAHAVKVIDSTGAGDAYAAGFIAARARGHDNVEAAQHAATAGALVVQKLGARVGTTWNQIINYSNEGAP